MAVAGAPLSLGDEVANVGLGMDAKARVMLLVGSALEVVERGEFLLGDDASALKGDALAALDGHLDALRGVWGFGFWDGVRRWVGCRAGAGSDEVTRTSTFVADGDPGARRGDAGWRVYHGP